MVFRPGLVIQVEHFGRRAATSGTELGEEDPGGIAFGPVFRDGVTRQLRLGEAAVGVQPCPAFEGPVESAGQFLGGVVVNGGAS